MRPKSVILDFYRKWQLEQFLKRKPYEQALKIANNLVGEDCDLDVGDVSTVIAEKFKKPMEQVCADIIRLREEGLEFRKRHAKMYRVL